MPMDTMGTLRWMSARYNIISWGSVPLIMVLAAGPWAAGTLNGVDYLMLSMLPILLTKLTASIAIDLFEWKHLMVSKRNIENLIQEPEEAGRERPLPRSGTTSPSGMCRSPICRESRS